MCVRYLLTALSYQMEWNNFETENVPLPAGGIRISYLGFRTSTDARVPTLEATASIFPSVRTHLLASDLRRAASERSRTPARSTFEKWGARAELGPPSSPPGSFSLLVISSCFRNVCPGPRHIFDAFRRRFRMLSGPAEQRISHPPRFEVRVKVNRRLVGESRRQG